MSLKQIFSRMFRADGRQAEAGPPPAAAVQAEVDVSGITPGTDAYTWLTGGAVTGKPLSEQDAMAQVAVYACVALIGGAVASMPVHIYRRAEAGRERVNNDLWWMLNEQMSTGWAAAVGWEFGMQSLLLHGDMFIRIDRASSLSPAIVGLTPLHPLSVDVRKEGDRLVYLHADGNKIRVYDQDDVLHVPGPGFNGKRGLSQIQHVLRQPANIARDAGEQTSALLNDGMRPDLALLAAPGVKLTDAQITQLRSQWALRYSGLSNSNAPIVLSGGMTIKELSMSAADAQLLETRNLTDRQIAQVFGVPPHMVGMTEKTTSWGSGVEQMSIGFVKYTLQRHLVKIEQEINRKCHRTARHFAEYDTKGLERGDIKTRNESYRVAIGRAGEPGWMTVNEVRAAENLPPVAGGDELNTREQGNDQSKEPDPATADS